jgi:hypothetical protein
VHVQTGVGRRAQAGMAPGATTAAAGAARAAALAAQWGVPGVGPAPDAKEAHFEAELEINDFPQHARWKARPRARSHAGSVASGGGRARTREWVQASPARMWPGRWAGHEVQGRGVACSYLAADMPLPSARRRRACLLSGQCGMPDLSAREPAPPLQATGRWEGQARGG